ncbi:response regulator [Elusimicrobiota bacterium]
MTKKHVLIADDMRGIVRVISKAFAKYPALFTIETAYDCEQAWEAISKRMPDLAIVDAGLHEMGGLNFCRKLRAHPKANNVKIISISSAAGITSQDVDACGIDCFFQKPMYPSVILGCAAQFLGIKLSRKKALAKQKK